MPGTAPTLAAIVLANDGIRLRVGEASTEAAIVRANAGIRLSAAVAVAEAAIVLNRFTTRLIVGVAVAEAVTVALPTKVCTTVNVEKVVGFAMAYACVPLPAVAVAYSSVEYTRTVLPVLLMFVASAAWLVRVFAATVLHVDAAG
jgi:hypothetical protein